MEEVLEMTIVVTGGGSGGHITPLLAVAHELKKQQPHCKIVYIGQTGDSLADVPAGDKNIDEVYTIRAGKLRRYHGEGLKQLLDIRTMLLNIRDIFWTLAGLWQSFFLLRKLKPQVVFVKGGFVGVPVGLASAALRIPYITHDSDALPGLANRIIAPWAKVHTVALPKEIYNYPPNRTLTVGVPLAHHFVPVTPVLKRQFREQVGLEDAGRVLLLTGGGLGAHRLNESLVSCAAELMQRYPDLYIVHLAGRTLEAGVRKRYQQELRQRDLERVIVKGFVTNLYAYSGAADVVIARAGATSNAELAAQAKACIIVPNPVLTGGHQLKNAKVLADRKAARMVSEESLKNDHHALMPALVDLFDHPEKAVALGKKFNELVEPDSAKRLSVVLLDVAAKYSRLA
jgi:UDP-N-acetylglucosamine--N-acetylmuramyl-(pentapeptide) pyrophosphoryl-undecaprenol N-acetylglucosamine transferase